MNVDKMEKMIRKVKGLLAIARDKKNDAEAQSALLMARQLMAKYNIGEMDINGAEVQSGRDILSYPATVEFKRLQWYEKDLSVIVALYFRVKTYRQVEKGKKRVAFFGFKDDCQMAVEIYHLALECMPEFAKMHVEEYYIFDGRYEERTRERTASVKDSYILGFLKGLDENFSRQTDELIESYGLTVLTPVEVEEKYEVASENFKQAKPSTKTISLDMSSYDKGVEDGRNMDKTPRTKIEG